MEIKRHWLGHDWFAPGAEGNVVDKTNVPNVRVAFRYNTLMEERTMVSLFTTCKVTSQTRSPQIRRHSKTNCDTSSPGFQTLQTRPDLFPPSMPADSLQGRDENVASLAMGATAMPDLKSLKIS